MIAVGLCFFSTKKKEKRGSGVSLCQPFFRISFAVCALLGCRPISLFFLPWTNRQGLVAIPSLQSVFSFCFMFLLYRGDWRLVIWGKGVSAVGQEKKRQKIETKRLPREKVKGLAPRSREHWQRLSSFFSVETHDAPRRACACAILVWRLLSLARPFFVGPFRDASRTNGVFGLPRRLCGSFRRRRPAQSTFSSDPLRKEEADTRAHTCLFETAHVDPTAPTRRAGAPGGGERGKKQRPTEPKKKGRHSRGCSVLFVLLL